PSRTEIRDFPMPDIPEDSALMKMEVAGICGTDVKLYKTPPPSTPVIMGHENIRTIARAGRELTRRKRFAEGGLVCVEHYHICRAHSAAARLPYAPGQQSHAQSVISKQARASLVIVTGTSRDAARMKVAKELGADYEIDVQKEDPLARVKEITGGKGVDVVLD